MVHQRDDNPMTRQVKSEMRWLLGEISQARSGGIGVEGVEG